MAKLALPGTVSVELEELCEVVSVPAICLQSGRVDAETTFWRVVGLLLRLGDLGSAACVAGSQRVADGEVHQKPALPLKAETFDVQLR